LPEIVKQTNQILEEIIEQDGTDVPKYLMAELTNADLVLKDKIDSYHHVISRFTMETEYWKAQAEKYTRVAKACDNVKKRLRENIKFAMLNLDQKEIAGTNFKFKLCKSKSKMEIDESVLPSKFLTEIISYEPNRIQIQAALDKGEKVPGVKLIPCESLRILINKNK
jgi:hypothetical protein